MGRHECKQENTKAPLRGQSGLRPQQEDMTSRGRQQAPSHGDVVGCGVWLWRRLSLVDAHSGVSRYLGMDQSEMARFTLSFGLALQSEIPFLA